ncbi:Inherit from NOG: secreted protein [Seminavis robusta]|uniref:Inherit from NOG: secreted protein n=1 Tax=Seminavis robusta TaxID=568900 RepID=A0A9N8DH73_9STRA|nr:Inherit from NOG: secreted protein [Seminavis robusta]|eukprot:Sro89_g046900.1 Inherit from NOG: secreted protein (591) ;mRNA; f:48629-50401
MMDEPNPPVWPDSVIIVHDTEDADTMKQKLEPTQDSWNAEHNTFTCDYHFSDRRYAVLFTPGIYRNVDLEVGYYVQVAGLGVTPNHVQFKGDGKGPHVPSLNRHIHKNSGTCLDTFWRSGENFSCANDMVWAVSQASPLRRVHCQKDLYLHDKDAYASGGHIANAVVDGHTHFGGQQQYLSRNVHFGKGASGGAWSMVYVGCGDNAPPNSATNTTITKTRVRVEKPYIAVYDDDKTKFQLRIPLVNDGTTDNLPQVTGDNEESRDFRHVKVATASESTRAIQKALDEGKDVVLTPGIYYLDQSLDVHKDNQVVLGLGLATLVSPVGSPCIRVAPGTAGVRIAGVMLEAPAVDPAKRKSTESHWSLLEYGCEGQTQADDPKNPGALFDIFCRVGGGGDADKRHWINIDSMVRIHSSHVIGDNLWLWRADHAELNPGESPNCPNVSPVFYQTEKDEYNVDTGIVVTGDNVTIYGLAVEHTSKHQTIWKGENGAVYFYQCEFPYDVDTDFGKAGYRGYFIGNSVKAHSLNSPGIYSNFRNATVQVETAIQHPDSPEIEVVNPFTVHLDNNGIIASVINGRGPAAQKQGVPSRV